MVRRRNEVKKKIFFKLPNGGQYSGDKGRGGKKPIRIFIPDKKENKTESGKIKSEH